MSKLLLQQELDFTPDSRQALNQKHANFAQAQKQDPANVNKLLYLACEVLDYSKQLEFGIAEHHLRAWRMRCQREERNECRAMERTSRVRSAIMAGCSSRSIRREQTSSSPVQSSDFETRNLADLWSKIDGDPLLKLALTEADVQNRRALTAIFEEFKAANFPASKK